MLDGQKKMVDIEGEECKTCGMGFRDLSRRVLKHLQWAQFWTLPWERLQ